jgi:hypothetical protein
MAGSLDVYPASTCAGVVSRGGCEAALPPMDALLPALDPEEACQQAIEDGLVVHRAHPLNGEISIPALIGGVVMPNAKFYVRKSLSNAEVRSDELAAQRARAGPASPEPILAGHR